ncbi:EAL domain-containing protein [Glaciimonas sp. Cout2]|uniref:bifunctional diguanylate cyclase/phosphodiesterase n=1 Tax=Glaciimonas sp. Cout2 TaxID=3048621 RepID=UPI002B2381F2|nr:EAL domain-containing protein [Glaciimonas sp. Cout2]MEB0014171.1 EAL domain-containing protein [Glaciimonas sp. Cout2]
MATSLGFLRGALRTILLWPIIGLLLAVAIWSLTSSHIEKEKQTLLKNGTADVALLSGAYAEQVARPLEQIDQITRSLKYYWETSAGTLKLEDQTRAGLYPVTDMLYVTIADRHGDILSTTLPRKTVNLAQRDYFLTLQNKDTNELLITKPSIGAGSGKMVIRFSRRLNTKDGVFDGIVMVSVEPSYFYSPTVYAALGKNGFLSLRTIDGVVLAKRMGESIRLHPTVFKATPTFITPTGIRFVDNNQFIDGRSRIVAWQKIKNYPLLAVAGLSEDELLIPLQAISREQRTLALARIAGVLTFAMIAVFFTCRLAWRKHQFTQAREAYGISSKGGNEGFFMLATQRRRGGVIVDFIIADCNEYGAAQYETTRDQLVGRKLSTLYINRSYFEKLMRTYVEAIKTNFYEDDFLIPEGSPLKMTWVHRKMMRSTTGLALTLRDISESKAHEQALLVMANSDALTALPNRHWLMGFLPLAINRARTSQTSLALLFVDLDDFKNINDTMGHAAGDELLQAAAARLRSVIRPIDNVVRLGGDEFTIIIESPEDAATVESVSQRVIAALKKPFLLAGQSSHIVCASIGISIFPKDGEDVETLIKHADIAMYAAKANGKASYQFFRPQLSQNLVVRLNNEQGLRAAIESDEFVLFYQPRVDTASGELRSLEALVRWEHPTRGLVQPDEFIRLAEETGLIVKLGELVIEKACAQLSRWKADNVPLVPVSINVSSPQFNQGNFDAIFASHMKRYGIDPSMVEIELTESCMMGEDLAIFTQLAALKSLGVKLLLDDFGTGYSSLSQLQRLDLDILKVDRAFTAKLGKSKEGEVFFMAIISMAHVLNMRVVAEGVETLEQLNILQALSCNEIQGYYISRPVSATEIEKLMHKRFLFPEGTIEMERVG